MALAETMKNFVNDLKMSRHSRHEFVKGNRENAKNMMAENKKFHQSIREQNKTNAEQTRAFLRSAREERMINFKAASEQRRSDMERIHQAKDAIMQGAHAIMKEYRHDNQLAKKYWASLSNDEPIESIESAVEGPASNNTAVNENPMNENPMQVPPKISNKPENKQLTDAQSDNTKVVNNVSKAKDSIVEEKSDLLEKNVEQGQVSVQKLDSKKGDI